MSIQKYYQNKSRFNGVNSRYHLAKKIKDVPNVINLDEYEDLGTYWIALYALNNDIIYFESYWIEHIPEAI